MFLVLSEKSPWNVPGDQVAPFFGEKKFFGLEPIEIHKCKKCKNDLNVGWGGGHREIQEKSIIIDKAF